jgi:RNA polymerase sigma-70 factor (ECF subfamily)
MALDLVLDPDTALMLKVRQGDGVSFDLLLHRHRSSVVNHLFRSVRNRAIAEELAQDVFVRVYRSRERYQPEAKFTTWLFRITTNVALNWRRDSRYENCHVRLDDRELPKLELRSKDPNLEDVLLEQSRAMEIRKAVDTLPAKQLAAVLMHKYEGMDYAQIATVLNCSIPALKSILFRAYQTLRQRLTQFAPESVGLAG